MAGDNEGERYEFFAGQLPSIVLHHWLFYYYYCFSDLSGCHSYYCYSSPGQKGLEHGWYCG